MGMSDLDDSKGDTSSEMTSGSGNELNLPSAIKAEEYSDSVKPDPEGR